MQKDGNIDPFLEFVSGILEVLSNRDLMRFNEKYVKAVLLTLFHLDGLYIIYSETETYKGYIDILLLKDRRYAQYIQYEWLIELKYLKEKDANQLEDVIKAGKEQLARYTFSPDMIARIDIQNLKRALIVVTGKSKVEVFYT
jgi:hypothetical protein